MKKRQSRIHPNTWVILKQVGIGVIVIAITSLLITGVWYGSRVSALTIDTIQVAGGETVQHSQVEKAAKETLEGSYLGLVPRQFSWFYPKSEVINKVEEIERLHNVKVIRQSGSELLITFDEYVPTALWCESVSGENCLFLDEAGFAFGRAPNLSGGSFLRFVTSGVGGEVGQNITDEEQFQSLVFLVDLLSQNGWFVSYVELDQVEDAFLAIVGGGELKISAAEEPEKIVENLMVVLASEEFAHVEPGNFQYIDLRFGNKVFVNEEIATSLEEMAIDTATSSEAESID